MFQEAISGDCLKKKKKIEIIALWAWKHKSTQISISATLVSFQFKYNDSNKDAAILSLFTSIPFTRSFN